MNERRALTSTRPLMGPSATRSSSTTNCSQSTARPMVRNSSTGCGTRPTSSSRARRHLQRSGRVLALGAGRRSGHLLVEHPARPGAPRRGTLRPRRRLARGSRTRRAVRTRRPQHLSRIPPPTPNPIATNAPGRQRLVGRGSWPTLVQDRPHAPSQSSADETGGDPRLVRASVARSRLVRFSR